ncbi:MAG: FAD-binding protein [Candidatus Hodarchaeales archaeon]
MAKGQKVKIYHSTTNSTRRQQFKEGEFIDVSDLNNVLEVNEEKKFALVEPNVPMDALVEETLKYGLVPPVIMEFPGITVGGGIQGGAGESSSFKWGAFHETCEEYEIIIGNGDIITASADENSDLFHGTVCSYGSLGVITKTKINLVSAKPYVHLKYYRVESFQESIDLIKEKSKGKIDYIDGIMFRKDLGSVVIGTLSDGKEIHNQTFTKAFDDWFYIHAQKMSEKHSIWEEIVPIRDYLFRYDRGGFWVGLYGFRGAHIPFNKLTRFLLNPIMKTRKLYGALHAGNLSQNFMVQDISFPRKNVLKFMNWIDDRLGIYPLWICPLKPDNKAKLSPLNSDTDLVINIGVWGRLSDDIDHYNINRDLEKKADSLSGKKILYAHAYYPREEFWKIYDYQWYTDLRSKYHAKTVFPDIYDKVHVSETYNPSNNKSVLKFLTYSTKLPITRKS